jgi:RNA polymerase sigma-70 factor, ECF subfamily
MFNNKKYDIEDEETLRAVEELRKGSAEAFHILYKTYNQQVYRFCIRLLGSQAIAQDAFQETFIKVYEHRKDFRGNNFPAWMFTIARHVCLNYLRTKKENASFEEEFHSFYTDSDSDVGMKDFVQKAITKLPVSLREAILLREYEDCSYGDIAEILGIDLSLAKVRVHRARLILRKLLQPLVKEIYESR